MSGDRPELRALRLGTGTSPAEAGRELRAEQEDLRRVVEPEQQSREGCGGAESRGLRRSREVQADRPAAEMEQSAVSERAPEDRSPGEPACRQIAIDQRDQAGDQAERDREVEQCRRRSPALGRNVGDERSRSAASAVETDSETSSRKPTARIRPKDSNRGRASSRAGRAARALRAPDVAATRPRAPQTPRLRR